MSDDIAAAWAALVTTAVLGVDRHPVPPPGAGWDAWSAHRDPAVQLLDRGAALTVARRAGVMPAPPMTVPPPAPADPRRPCSPEAGHRLERMLAGEHPELLAEWCDRCERANLRLPDVMLPAMLLRARRWPELDLVVRALAGDRAAWLAEAMPELGVRPRPPSREPRGERFAPAPRPDDSEAVVGALAAAFHRGTATWAGAPRLRVLVTSVDPDLLPSVCEILRRAPFSAQTERTRVELLRLAEFRHEMLAELSLPGPTVQP